MFCCYCGYCVDDESRHQRQINARINRQIRKERQRHKTHFQLLLLGGSKSGKSTLSKQIHIIYKQGYPTSQRIKFKAQVFYHIKTSIYAMLEAMGQLELSFADPEAEQHARVLGWPDVNKHTIQEPYSFSPLDEGYVPHTHVEVDPAYHISPEEFTAIRSLWADQGMKKCFEMRSKFQISDSAKHYLDSLDRISTDGYIPSLDDVLHTHITTVGLMHYIFQTTEQLNFLGSRPGWKRWKWYFGDIDALLLLIAINEYDMYDQADVTQNLLQESLEVFEAIISYPWFQDSSIILFMNKTDLFMEKIRKSPISPHFPEYRDFQYKGSPAQDHDADAVKEFICTRFLSVVPDHRKKHILVHFTCAVDRENIKCVFEDVCGHLSQRIFKSAF